MNGIGNESTWWDPVAIGDGDCHRFAIGPRRIWVRCLGYDLGWAHAGSVGEDEAATHGPVADEDLADLSWQRWAINRDRIAVRVRPLLHDRALVVRSQQVLSIAPQVTVRYFIGIPCVLRLELLGGPPLTLGEVPSVELSRTWFGDPTDGQLCLALKSRARRRLEEVELLPHRILCPLEIRNDTNEPFTFERACVRVQHCGIFRGGSRLWASAVRIAYRGPELESQIDVENHPPQEARDAIEVSPPREPIGKRGGLFTLAGLRGAWMSV